MRVTKCFWCGTLWEKFTRQKEFAFSLDDRDHKFLPNIMTNPA